jgi:hypothetical protein
MNKDTLLIILLIVIIIIALYYLINNNNKENNALESFSQQNSLSTYYQQTVDANELDRQFVRNKFNRFEYSINENRKHWNGNWELNISPSPLYFSFLRVNDQLVISISKQLYNLDKNNINIGTDVCSPDTFVGIGSLNKSGKYFILNKIICDNLKTNFNLDNNKLFGYIDLFNPNHASLAIKYDNTNGLKYNLSPLVIKRIIGSNIKYDNTSSYLSLSSYINPIPQYTNSYNDNLDVCHNSNFGSYNIGDLKKCYIVGKGLPVKGEIGENKYGTGCSRKTVNMTTNNGSKYSKCSDNTQETCLINMPDKDNNIINIDGYTHCNTNFDITRKFDSNLNNGLYNTFVQPNGICSYLSNFSTKFNSAIIMYVSDLTNIQSLNYEYFGQGANKSNLTMQTDITTNFMGKILKTLRNYIKNSSTSEAQLNSALSLTNCFESNDSSETHSSILNACKQWDTFTNTKFNTSTLNNIIPSTGIKPLIWKLNIDNVNSSSCTFSLSSSNLYKKENQWVKYVEFNPSENKTNMSLYKGGTNQSIILENASIIKENITASASTNGINDTYILLSGNLRTSNPKKYLIPSNVKSGFFNNSSTINLQNNVNNTGKWVILGFNLDKEGDLITTLNAIQKKM